MKAKKILGLLLAVTMTVGTMTACGNGGNDQAAGEPRQAAGSRASRRVRAARMRAVTTPETVKQKTQLPST